jgi:hypothetical protein
MEIFENKREFKIKIRKIKLVERKIVNKQINLANYHPLEIMIKKLLDMS